jgi:hypothetical protein
MTALTNSSPERPMSYAPMSKRLVLGEFVAMCVSYALGLAVVLVVLVDLPAGQFPTLLVGLGIFLASYAVLFWLLSRRLPPFMGARPWRYSIPLGIATVAALWWSVTAREPGAPDVATYVVAIPILIAGQAFSSIWWSTAGASRDPRDET